MDLPPGERAWLRMTPIQRYKQKAFQPPTMQFLGSSSRNLPPLTRQDPDCRADGEQPKLSGLRSSMTVRGDNVILCYCKQRLRIQTKSTAATPAEPHQAAIFPHGTNRRSLTDLVLKPLYRPMLSGSRNGRSVVSMVAYLITAHVTFTQFRIIRSARTATNDPPFCLFTDRLPVGPCGT